MSFGSWDNFTSAFSLNYRISEQADSAGPWLAYNKRTGNLEISTATYEVLPDQTNDLVPLFTSDVLVVDMYLKHFKN